MADPYGSSDAEDMSSFLQILLHNSPASAATTDTAASAATSGLFCSGGAIASVAECSSSTKFSDPRSFYPEETDAVDPSTRVKNLVSSREESEASEIPANPAPPRSSKRSRATEVHNLSEKRRRSRINEKLKALQSLIPNSNKTDKASMLDEAIEYLKQLQMQVQMLTMRNGLSLHPGYSLGTFQPMCASPAGLVQSDERNVFLNANRGTDTLSRDDNVSSTQNAMEDSYYSSSAQPMLMPSLANSTNLGILPSVVPSMERHYGLNHLAASKDVCRDDMLSGSRLEMSCSGNNSSPGVSS